MWILRGRSIRWAMLAVCISASLPLAAQEPSMLARQPIWVAPVFEAEDRSTGYDEESPRAREIDREPNADARCIAYSPDGKTLAVGDGPGGLICEVMDPLPINENGGLIRLVDVATNRVKAVLKPAKVASHEYYVQRVAFSADGKTLISQEWDITRDRQGDFAFPSFTIWDVDTGWVRSVIRGGENGHWSRTAIAPDGRAVAAVSPKEILVWNTMTGGLVGSFPVPSPDDARLVFSSDSRLLAFGDKSGTVTLIDPATVRLFARFEAHEKHKKRIPVEHLAFSPDGRFLAVGGSFERGVKDGFIPPVEPQFAESVAELRLFDVEGRFERATMRGLPDESFSALAFSPDGKTLASAGETNSHNEATVAEVVRLWDTANGRARTSFRHEEGQMIIDMKFSPDGKVLATGGYDPSLHERTIVLRDTATGDERAVLKSDRYNPYEGVFAFSPDGRSLASTYGSLLLWDLALALAPREDGGHLEGVWSLAYSPDGKTLASASEDRTIKLWDLATKRPRATLRGHRANVYSLAYSPDGKTIASGDAAGEVRLWDAATGAERAAIRAHDEPIFVVQFSPDGRIVTSMVEPQDWRIEAKSWDAATGQPTGRLLRGVVGLEGASGMLAFCHDGRSTLQLDPQQGGIVRDIGTGVVRSRFPAGVDFENEESVVLAVSRDGRFTAAIRSDEAVGLWDLAGHDGRGDGLLIGGTRHLSH